MTTHLKDSVEYKGQKYPFDFRFDRNSLTVRIEIDQEPHERTTFPESGDNRGLARKIATEIIAGLDDEGKLPKSPAE